MTDADIILCKIDDISNLAFTGEITAQEAIRRIIILTITNKCDIGGLSKTEYSIE